MVDRSALTRWLNAMSSARVSCLGDVMLDRFVYGAVDRVSPEAPIPVLRVTRDEAMLGAAGNVARNLIGLGARCTLLSVVGDDPAAAELSTLIAATDGVAPELGVEPSRRTTIKTRFIAGGQQLLRADRETALPIGDAAAAALLEAVAAACADAGALVLSDYGKGVLTDAVVAGAVDRARAAGVPIVVDPKGRDYRRYRGADLITPNRRELGEASGLPVDGEAEILAAARALAAEAEVGAVLVTRSEQGMSLVPADGAPTHLSAEAREVFDVSGAGDTVVATLAAAIAAGAPLPDAARLANAAAGIVVAKVGTAAVRAGELERALNAQPDAEPVGDAPLEAALEQVAVWQRLGLRVGFTNGCFDLLHPGHLSLLRQAKDACDRLVVGLNSDDSVRRLKGPGRPVQGAAARAEVMSALAMVDLVVTVDDDTPEALIRALRPDLLVKGADYTEDQVVGAGFVRSYGGEVLLAELADGFSTSRTVDKLAGD